MNFPMYFKPIFLCLLFYFFFVQIKQNGKWKIISTSILITSDADDKMALYNACKNKYVVLSNDSLFFKTDCLFGEIVRGKCSKPQVVNCKDLLYYFDNKKLISLVLSKCAAKKYYILSTVKFKLGDGTIDSCKLILNDLRDRMLIFYDPYVLSLVPNTNTKIIKGVGNNTYLNNLINVNQKPNTENDIDGNELNKKNNDGTSCFIKGTMITLSDGTTKAIEHIRKGDKILSMNLDRWATEVSTVLEVDSPFHHKMVEISFWGEDSIINRNTFDHPYYVVGKGWCSYKPAETKLKYGIDAQQLSVGDICFEYFLGHLLEIRVKSIKEIVNYQRTYNLLKLSNDNNYFANNVLVNNEAESTIDTLVKQKKIGKLKINDLFGEWRVKDLKILVLPNVLSKTEKRNISEKYRSCKNSIFMIGRNGIISKKSESCEFSNCSEVLGNLLTVKRLPIIGSSQERYDPSSDITDTNIVWRPFVKLIDKNYDYSTIDVIQTNCQSNFRNEYLTIYIIDKNNIAFVFDNNLLILSRMHRHSMKK